MLEQARRRFSDQQSIELRLGESEHLPLRDGEADVAIMNMVLHHLSQPEEGIREVNRVLKTGDRFIVVDFEKHEQEQMRKSYGDRWLGFESRRIRHWLGSSGFGSVDERGFELGRQLRLIIYTARKITNGGAVNGSRKTL